MPEERRRIRTTEDSAADAVALMRSIDADRRARPIPRPALAMRFASRLFDCVVFALLTVVLLSAFLSIAEPPPDPESTAQIPTSTSALADTEMFVNWGPVGVSWATAAAFCLVLVAFVTLEVVQTRVFGATVGKRWNRIRIVSASGAGVAGSLQIAVRSAVLALPFVVVVVFWFASVLYAWAGLGTLIAFGVLIRRDEHQRGPHDKLARTEVVSAEPPL